MQLHNQLIMSILGSSSHHTPLTPPPDAPGKVKPTRKRRRALPYQSVDPNDPSSLRSSRLKKWTVGIGRAERERVKSLAETASRRKVEPRREVDEIVRERGVALVPEGKECLVSRSLEAFIPCETAQCAKLKDQRPRASSALHAMRDKVVQRT